MQNDLVQLMKKREKLNNSALDRIGVADPLNNSRKFTQQYEQNNIGTTKIYDKKIITTANSVQPESLS